MRRLFEQRFSRTARWSRRLGVFAAIVLLIGGCWHRYELMTTPNFLIIFALAGVLALLALCSAAFAVRGVWVRGDHGGADLVLGALAAAAVLFPFGWGIAAGLSHPVVHNVSTDLDNPPPILETEGRGRNAPEPYTAGERETIAHAYPTLRRHRYETSREKVVAALRIVAAADGWETIGEPDQVVGSDYLMHAVARTFLLRFPADVSVRVSDDGLATYVDMRSASRYGEHDFGDNAARIERFLADLDEAVAGQEAPAPN